MKKYHQLLLLIISIVSLSLFLIYRHEYNRLHYVLEVFNFFGQPCNVSNLQRTDQILSQRDWGPRPTWQEYDVGYIYSAFLIRKDEVKALTVAGDDKIVARNCHFWYEDKKKPVLGKFRFSKVTRDESLKLTLFYYFCTGAGVDQPPYAVSFSYKPKKESDLKKVMLDTNLNRKLSVNATLCVSPSVYSKRRLVEFLSFHKLIGIDSFIFYNRDVPHRLVKLITNLSTRLGIELTFYDWNFPRNDSPFTRTLVENDCLLRTFGTSRYVATLELNEFIVPIVVNNFNMLMENFDSKSDRLSLPVQKFCVGSVETNKPISMLNTEIDLDYTMNLVRFVYRSVESKEAVNTFAVDRSRASIHKYVKCPLAPSKTRTDRSILRFSTDLLRSTLFQLLLQNQI